MRQTSNVHVHSHRIHSCSGILNAHPPFGWLGLKKKSHITNTHGNALSASGTSKPKPSNNSDIPNSWILILTGAMNWTTSMSTHNKILLLPFRVSKVEMSVP